ncbi:hypothetical protein ABZZ36_05345 [Actinacidiphila glaucinigra]|uniref:hypothetical protein n=1 Tax=Actinacidiphila glaucinigra TaxID=235986 RepID=UPI0033B43959
MPGYVSEQLLSMSWIPDAEDVARIVPVAKRWLRSDDAFRAAVAIGLEDETFPADSWEEIAALAAPLKERSLPWPPTWTPGWHGRSRRTSG